MNENLFVGRLLAGILIVLIILSVLLLVARLLGFGPGRLPGDIVLHGRGWTFYFPVVTCLVVSLLLTLVMNLLNRWWR